MQLLREAMYVKTLKRVCIDQVFDVRQVNEKYQANGKMYFGHLWIWKRRMIRLIIMVFGRCQEFMCMELEPSKLLKAVPVLCR